MKKAILLLFAVLMMTSVTQMKAQNRRSNPIVSHMFTADASAHVWQDGRLYVYPSTDLPGTGYGRMDGYHVFSTDDMITWKDHGEILHSRDVEWGRKEGGYMWAPDCVYKNGSYYFFFPHKNTNDVWEIGVATSKNPASDFKMQGYVKGGNTYCDPCVFIDDDGQAYIYAVVNAKSYAAKLSDDFMEIEGEMVLQTGLDGHREGPFVFKRKGMYYLIYPDDFPKFNKMRYSTSTSPLGPWECKGVFLGSTDVITTHGSCVEYKGQWYLFYHNGNLSGGFGTNRSICFDPIYFNEDGTIKMVEQTLGVQEPTFHNDINFNGMFGTLPVGSYKQADLEKYGIKNNAISSVQIPEGYIVECFEEDNFKGKSWLFGEDRIDLSALACNDVISSVKISKTAVENLVKNPSFELAIENQFRYWRSRSSFVRYSDSPALGYYSLQYKGKEMPKDLIQSVKLTPNTNYEISVALKIEAGTSGKVIFGTVENIDEDCKFELAASTKADEWVEFKAVFNSGDIPTIQLRCATSDDFNGVCYWDNVVLKVK
jgi:hypothetical protein